MILITDMSVFSSKGGRGGLNLKKSFNKTKSDLSSLSRHSLGVRSLTVRSPRLCSLSLHHIEHLIDDTVSA